MTDTTCDWPLVSILSHELRTPLAVIKTATELLLTQDPALDARSLCLSISRCERRLEELARKFLLTFEIETGAARQRFETERARVSLSCCLETALRLTEAVVGYYFV